MISRRQSPLSPDIVLKRTLPSMKAIREYERHLAIYLIVDRGAGLNSPVKHWFRGGKAALREYRDSIGTEIHEGG